MSRIIGEAADRTESAMGELRNAMEMLEFVSYWSVCQVADGEPLPTDARDAMIGAVNAMKLHVDALSAAHEAELSARLDAERPRPVAA
ncbi:hypothetical protein [Tranquillimonas alkanivorans]|uniref:Uncharacterized protein n=1 Tax=Tranquillimonas alkanivorans TaxID=441119 RepID=A0A1I5L1Y4_9RHOB|nr:hypothetical protein [Tranquillimonas alkanivorans]SFO91183.1 hypothetical protein SAMN04488047_101416 [Tranquillimonas alkanivorans]